MDDATAVSVSLWVWIPKIVEDFSELATSETMFPISVGKFPPLVSQSTIRVAPALIATFNVCIEYSGFSWYPSKKCSASKNTSFLLSVRNLTESSIIERFSSRDVSSTSRT